MGWLAFDETEDLVCGDDPVDLWRTAMRALWARRAAAPPAWDEILEAALLHLNRHGEEWIDPWPGPIRRLQARTPLGAVVASSGGDASPDPRTLAVVRRALEELSLTYRETWGGLGRKPRLKEVLYYLRDVAPCVITFPARGPAEPGAAGRADLLYEARRALRGAPLPPDVTVAFELGAPPPGSAPGEEAAADALVDGARYWLDDAGELVCEAAASILARRLDGAVEYAREGERIPFERLLHALFDLSRHDLDGYLDDSPAFAASALALHAGEGPPLLVVRELSAEAYDAMEPLLHDLAMYVSETSDLYLEEAGHRPRVAELFACTTYALNLLDASAWLSGVPAVRPLRIAVAP